MKYSKYILLIATLGDLLLLNICFILAFCYVKGFNQDCLSTTSIIFFIYINLAWIISINLFKDYKIDRQAFKKTILFTYLKTVVFFFFLFLLFFQVFNFNYLPRDAIKIQFPVFLTLLLFWQYLLYTLLWIYRRSGYNYRNVVIIGHSSQAEDLVEYFKNNPWAGYRFKGFFTHHKQDEADIVGVYTDLESFVINNSINEIYILTNEAHKSIKDVISEITSKHAVEIRLVPDLSFFSFMSLKLVDYDLLPVIKIEEGPLSFWYNRLLKRLFDILVALFNILFILSWMIPLLWLINLMTGNGRLFYTQKRSGLNGQTFNLIKFRTMKKNKNADEIQAIKDDKRVTKLGRFLRKSSIDELPQFFNVLLGQMSAVGPRPHMLKHTEEYKELVGKFMIRHTVRPGITGYAQVRGARGEIRTIKDIEKRINLDISYVENWSLWLDIKICFLTVLNAIVGDKNAY